MVFNCVGCGRRIGDRINGALRVTIVVPGVPMSSNPNRNTLHLFPKQSFACGSCGWRHKNVTVAFACEDAAENGLPSIFPAQAGLVKPGAIDEWDVFRQLHAAGRLTIVHEGRRLIFDTVPSDKFADEAAQQLGQSVLGNRNLDLAQKRQVLEAALAQLPPEPVPVQPVSATGPPATNVAQAAPPPVTPDPTPAVAASPPLPEKVPDKPAETPSERPEIPEMHHSGELAGMGGKKKR